MIPVVYPFDRQVFTAPVTSPGVPVEIITAEIVFKRRTKLLQLYAGVTSVDPSGFRKEISVSVAVFPNTIGEFINPPPSPARLTVTAGEFINGLNLRNNNGGVIDYRPPGGIYIDASAGTFVTLVAFGLDAGDQVAGGMVMSVFPVDRDDDYS